ncbi:uncharacterized protein (TIGR00369 family) [Natronocella acetinitrilica]|uniref:Uncharacterized protein (TIGR00369 family) n=1 Tax=Natronocella acetinitrilica TaxID=414046 RepID=A0AAE3KGR3_9GAMM|nr:PaaI family thioesterase [Natronocella acetinitrilica]MCP1675517.1 uncharacterized protein (TIGR00369 family) [Natronocella acetinitrilica]
MTDDASALQWEVARHFFSLLPHGRRLGIELDQVGASSLSTRLAYRDELVGNPGTGVIHGGVITTAIDQTSGAAAIIAIDPPEAVATLDLRIDHLRTAQPGRTLHCEAICYKVTRSVAFVRCVAHDGDDDNPVAVSMSSFMRLGQAISA